MTTETTTESLHIPTTHPGYTVHYTTVVDGVRVRDRRPGAAQAVSATTPEAAAAIARWRTSDGLYMVQPMRWVDQHTLVEDGPEQLVRSWVQPY